MPVFRDLLRPVKRRILGAANRLGYDIVHLPDGAAAARDIRMRWIETLGIDMVLDVGANEGQFVGWMRDRGFSGGIVSFEPQRAVFERCASRWSKDPMWKGIHTALGEASAEITMNVAGNSVSSSLLPMLESHVDALPESAIVATETVSVARLDEAVLPYLAGAKSVFLKIDTQGYERPVLRGASAVLGRVNFIELEMSLVPLYEGQVLMPDMMKEVEALGFTPVALENGFADPAAGRVLQVDGLFVRSSMLEAR